MLTGIKLLDELKDRVREHLEENGIVEPHIKVEFSEESRFGIPSMGTIEIKATYALNRVKPNYSKPDNPK